MKIVTMAERPDLERETDAMNMAGWPEFMLHDPVADALFGHLYDMFPEYQSLFLDDDGKVIACGNAIPVTWDGTLDDMPLRGWDAIMERGVANYQNGISPNTLSAIQAVISKPYQGTGMSQQVILAIKAVAQQHGLTSLIAPVRPNWKHRYPLTPMDNYVRWQNADGLMFDPWLRTHQRLGATFARVCPEAMTISGTIEQWEQWTAMRFPETGTYIVPGALSPVEINCEQNSGRYVEPNVWMKHSVA